MEFLDRHLSLILQRCQVKHLPAGRDDRHTPRHRPQMTFRNPCVRTS